MVKSGQKNNKGARPLPKKTWPLEEEVIHTKPMQEVTGVPGLSFDEVADDNLVESSLWITKRGKKTIVQDEEDDKLENLIQFTKEDIKDEIEYWNNAVYCFVLGANPPWEVLNGFILQSKDRDVVLQAGHFMFDNKPLIVRAWTEETEFIKEDVKNVPTWVRIKALPLKFWGKCLPTISGLLGKFQRADQAIVDKTRLGFARVMIEVAVGQKFPTKVKFLDENGKIVALDVEYEWKPTVCSKCKGIGHEHTNCRSGAQTGNKKVTVQKVWKPVAKPAAQLVNTQVSVPNEERTHISSPVKPVTSAESSPDRSYKEVASGCGTPKVGIGQKVHTHQGHCKRFRAAVLPNNGDFNTVIKPDERLGGNTKQSDMDEFIDCLATCGMTDIPATGAFYTWTNKQDPESRIYSRLDRFLVNQEWQSSFPDMMAQFHPAGLFDHSPCTVSNAKLVMTRRVSFTLTDLNKECFADIENATKIAESELAAVQVQIDSDPQNANLIQKELDITAKLKHFQPARISFLKQKAKTQWLEDGDSNTAYFHGVIRGRYSKSIQDAFLDYYESLLGSRKSTEKVRTEVLNQGRYCTDEHIQMLNKPITNEEIKSIFFNTPNDKAPGPDGYTSAFFKDSWDIIGEDICAAIKDFFYLRLSLVLLDIVSENQGAFIKRRSIIENVLICQDIVQLYMRKVVSPRCLFKIDLQKAYDTVEWEFLEQLLHGLGFSETFSHRVMTCVTSTRFSLCLNGSQFGYFKGQRWLRQGDPISPLLFTLCMDYLTRMISYATDHWPFQYHPLYKGVKLNHLMFADDLLMFCKGNAQSIMLFIKAFSSFSIASGLTMNNAKSEVYYNGVSL
ncbi:uncharacterized protein LOC141607750 [Silene latifolia]|uniref:uncharacterized protein LOC141607750 n=1 Tax=Silene latifolia TaxID=37657 RepID=UPI003D7804DE